MPEDPQTKCSALSAATVNRTPDNGPEKGQVCGSGTFGLVFAGGLFVSLNDEKAEFSSCCIFHGNLHCQVFLTAISVRAASMAQKKALTLDGR